MGMIPSTALWPRDQPFRSVLDTACMSLLNMKKDLLGFTGVAGLSWLCSVILSRCPIVDESLHHSDIAGPETLFCEVNGWPVAYRESGEGDETIVLIHGFGGRLETWDQVQPALARSYRTVSLDLWGFGASGRPRRITPLAWIDQVIGVMDALQIPTASLVAHSLGGRVSLLCTHRHPERINRLALIDADWGHIPHGYALAWGIAHTPALAFAMRRLRSNPHHISRLMRMAYGSAFALPDELVNLYCAPLRVHGTSQTFVDLGRAALHPGLARIPATLHCPTLILWGEEDAIIPQEWGKRLAQLMPHGEFHAFPAVGHFPQEEAPRAVLDHLFRFFQATPLPELANSPRAR